MPEVANSHGADSKRLRGAGGSPRVHIELRATDGGYSGSRGRRTVRRTRAGRGSAPRRRGGRARTCRRCVRPAPPPAGDRVRRRARTAFVRCSSAPVRRVRLRRVPADPAMPVRRVGRRQPLRRSWPRPFHADRLAARHRCPSPSGHPFEHPMRTVTYGVISQNLPPRWTGLEGTRRAVRDEALRSLDFRPEVVEPYRGGCESTPSTLDPSTGVYSTRSSSAAHIRPYDPTALFTTRPPKAFRPRNFI